MYGKELRVAISAEDLRFIDKFRATMRDALLSFEKLGEAQLQKELHDFCARGEVLDDGKEGRWFQPFGTSDSLPGLHPLLQDTVADATADAEENVLAAMHMMAVKKKKVTARKWPRRSVGPRQSSVRLRYFWCSENISSTRRARSGDLHDVSSPRLRSQCLRLVCPDLHMRS
ncbi:spn-E [Symbiodinium natans]|uniref:Spn-E protein n=1 Tax=Symbiodinium natans TaxID=878477 RepID=A0A812UTN2_9DINO|nr:spn-E [Symbiodinium natans]